MEKNDHALIIAAIARVVRLSTRYAWLVIPLFVIAAILSGSYVSRHIAINTDSSKLLSSSLPWRQQEKKLDEDFPQRIDRIIAVVDATTPEAADEASAALAQALSARADVIRTVSRPGGGEFFARNGILFLSLDEVRSNMAELIKAQPFLGTLAADPTLRGILGAVSQSLEGVRLKKTTLEDMRPAMTAISDALDLVAEGKHPEFSWRRLITGRAPEPSDLRRFVNIQPILDYGDLEPGGKATKVIRATIAELGLTPDRGVTVRLTGSVALSDEEFATVADGAALNGVVTILVVLLILWLALKQARIILAVLVNLAVGLTFTAAIGLRMVGALNLISVAFAVLFIGLGVDFGIQFSVRYRAERYAEQRSRRGASGDGAPRGGAASARRGLDCGRLLFVPADGLCGALRTRTDRRNRHDRRLRNDRNPASGAALRAQAGSRAGADRLGRTRAARPLPRPAAQLGRRRTLTVVILGLPLLGSLRFDFNPIDLRSKHVESVSTLLDLMRDPDTSPNTIDILESDLASASAMADKLRQLPEVAQVRTLMSFVPKDQDEKLAIIDDANFFFENTLNPDQVDAPPTPADTIKAIDKTAGDLSGAAGEIDSPAAGEARRLASLLTALAKAPAAERDEAERVLVTPLKTTLRQVRDLLTAEHVTLDTLPPSLRSDWVSPGGQVRIEAVPRGDANDNAVLRRFVEAVHEVAPQATGTPVFVVEAAATIVRAFLEAAVWSLVSIAVILFVTLRRLRDVALTLVPLLVAIVVTLEICVAIGLQLNFANIIALPLLLGVGVAFKIYYIMAWRAGETKFLQSSLTRAIFFSACTTATAFGSLWFSHHPGTSSMGKLMALSLVTTLSAAVLFQPALLATQRKTHPRLMTGCPAMRKMSEVWQNGDSRRREPLIA